MTKKRAKKAVPRPRKVVSKAAYVRSFPVVMPAKEVVATAKSQGIVLTEAYVYNVRATSKAGQKSRKAPARAGKRHRPNLKVKGKGAEELLRAVAAELGRLARELSVLQAKYERVRKLLGG